MGQAPRGPARLSPPPHRHPHFRPLGTDLPPGHRLLPQLRGQLPGVRLPRRSSVLGLAWSDGSSPSSSNRARIKRSIGVRGHDGSATAGSAVRRDSANDQWSGQSAPAAIQRVSVPICSTVRDLWLLGGGIRLSSSAVTRLTSRLRTTSPGTMANPPLSMRDMAGSFSSKRSPAFRDAASGP